MPISTEQLEWIKSQKSVLDEAIAEAGRSYFKHLQSRSNALFDLSEANIESYRLVKGLDLCYDRPSSGLVYGLWYHARRVNTSLALVLELVSEAENQKIKAYDLGAGTGAVQWAIALACGALEAAGKTPPKVSITNIDTSPFMLKYLEHSWACLSAKLPACRHIHVKSELNTWHQTSRGFGNTWLFASYLFDHEDKKESLSEDFDLLVEKLNPQHVVVSTSKQPKKVAFLDEIGARLKSADYFRREPVTVVPYIGKLDDTNQLRSILKQKVNSIRPQATWDDHSFFGNVFSKIQSELRMDSTDEPDDIDTSLSLFMPRVTNREEVQLSEEQASAARHDGYPTLIHGPAGCGKSIVITERIKNLVEERGYDPDLRILLTTFNKALTKDVLFKWLETILDENRVSWQSYKENVNDTCFLGKFENSDRFNIYLMHFDVLPTRLGLVHKIDSRSVAHGQTLRHLAIKAVEKAEIELRAEGYTTSELERVLDAELILEEYHRVFYGLYHTNTDRFLNRPRPGRPIFQRESKPRRALLKCLEEFKLALEKNRSTTFTERRKNFFEFLNPKRDLFPELLWVKAQGKPNSDKWYETEIEKISEKVSIDKQLPNAFVGYFTHIFVDEMQDCTRTDYAIFNRLLADPNELVVAGDLAQSVHMGRSSSSVLPRIKGGIQKNRRTRELKGSYRLPFRISEALVPLSQRIHKKRQSCKDQVQVSMQSPYRGSPPGDVVNLFDTTQLSNFS